MTFDEWFEKQFPNSKWKYQDITLNDVLAAWESGQEEERLQCALLAGEHASDWEDAEGETDSSFICIEFEDLAAEILNRPSLDSKSSLD